MINDFLIRAYPKENRLKVTLDGFFMKSELQLAIHLVRKESIKLNPGYEILLDIKNLKTDRRELNFNKLSRLLMKMGGGTILNVGLDYDSEISESNNGGFYPHENTWLSP